MKNNLLILLSMFMIGCATTPKIDLSNADPHPVEPEWVTFTRKPVIRGVVRDDQTNYEVSDEFIKRSLQMKDYTKRIQDWKRKNLVP